MGTVYLIDLTSSHDRHICSLPCPLAWCCAAELAGWTSAHDVIEAYQRTISTSSSNTTVGSSNAWHWLPFPVPVTVQTKYFTASVRLVIGCHIGHNERNVMRYEDCNGDAMQVALQTHFTQLHNNNHGGGANEEEEEERYGCVFVLDAEEPGVESIVVPWHLLPSSEACLFRAMLVYRAVQSHTQGFTCCEERLREDCIDHQCEYISHAPAVLAVSSKLVLEEVPRSVGQAGLLAGTLCGSARLLQLMHNVLWSNTAASIGKGTVTHGAPVHSPHQPSVEHARYNHFLLLYNDGDSNSDTDGASAAVTSFMHPQRHKRTSGEDVMDARFYCALVSPDTAPLEERNLLLLLVNRYYSALVQPHLLHLHSVTDATLQAYCAQPGAVKLAYLFTSHDRTTEETRHKLCKMLQEHGIELVAHVTNDDEENNENACTSRSTSEEHDVEHIALRTTSTHDELHMTSGYDRLRETLHCVEWPLRHTHALSTASKHIPTMPAVPANCCLFALHGGTVTQEETWLRKLLDCMHVTYKETPSTTNNNNTSMVEAVTWHMVPSLYLRSLEGNAHGSTSSSSDVSMAVGNKYFDATVQLYSDGGLRTRLMGSQSVSESIDTLQSLLAGMHAVVVLCTAESLTAAALAGRNARLRTMLIALQKILLLHEAEEQQRCTVDKGKTGDDEERLQSEGMLAMVYVTDITVSDVDAVASVEDTVQQLLTQAKEIVQSGAEVERGTEMDSSAVWPRFELVFAAPQDTQVGISAETKTGVSKDDVFDTHGYARVREALQQHIWTIVQRKDQTTKENSTTSITHSTQALPHTTSSTEVRNEHSADDVSDAESESVAMCALPSTYLVDPETLRSVRLTALTTLQEAEHNNITINSNAVQNELLLWVNKMKKYGGRLSWRRRKAQAELLALALEQLDTCKE